MPISIVSASVLAGETPVAATPVTVQGVVEDERSDGTMIEANGYLIIWADEDSEQEGLHANFKLSSDGETLTLVGSDTNGNLLLDTLTYGELEEDVSYGLTADGETSELTPSPGTSN